MINLNKKFYTLFILLNLFILQNNIVQAMSYADLILAPTSKVFYNTIQYELEFFSDKQEICLTDDTTKLKAPTVYKLIYPIVEKYALISKIPTPEIFIVQNNDHELDFNAGGGMFIDEEKKDRQVIILGKYFLNLFIWDHANTQMLETIIAHEIGHLVCHKPGEDKENELHADAYSVTLTKNPEIVLKTLKMNELGSYVLETLRKYFSKKEEELIHFFTKVITCTIIKKFPFFGKIEELSLQACLDLLIEKILSPLTYNSHHYMNRDVAIFNAFNNFRMAITAPDLFLGINYEQLLENLETIKQKLNKEYMKKNKPHYEERKKNIEKIKSLTPSF